MAHTADLELTAEELRVLGALIEKERATPDQYPLTTNALRTACNQKSSRDPVVDYAQAEVETAMLSLRDKGYARTVTGSGRTVKHKQVLDEALGLSNGEVSLLGVLMLRGPQTPNELRTRTDRLHGFESNDAVERTLATMASGQPSLVRCIGRESGQREDRWVHLLADEDAPPGVVGGATATSPPASRPDVPEPTNSGTSTSAAGGIPTGAPTTATPATAGPSAQPARGPQPQSSPHHAEPAVVASESAPSSPPTATPTPASTNQPSADAARIAELEAEVADLRAEVDRLRDRFDDLAGQLGMSPS